MSSTAPDLDALVALNQEMAALVRAGIPLEIGLKQAAATWPSRFSQLADRIAQRLSLGESLSDALQQEGPTISPAYAAVVEAGLAAGRLPEALEELADLGLTVQDLRRRIWLATVYPAIVCSLAYAMFVGFIVFGVPVWTQTREALFLPPRWLFTVLAALHDTVRWWGPAIPLALVIFVIVQWMRADHTIGRHLTSGLWIPGIGATYRYLVRAQFARMLALLIEHKVPAGRAFALVAETTEDAGLQYAAWQIAADLEGGATWSRAVGLAHRLPSFLRWMMVAGEKQGALAPVLRQAASAYQRKAERWLEWIRGSLPILLVGGVCGCIVFLYCVGLFIPMQQFWYDLLKANP